MNHETEQRALRTLDNLSTAVLQFDAGLKLRYLNPGAEHLLQESENHALGQSADELWPHDLEVVERMREALRSNHPYSDREVALTLAHERRTVVCCMVTPVVEPGRASELVVELVPVERHLRIAREKHLLSQNNATRTLIRGLAHEIKNPLGGLRGAAQLLEQELPNDELREYTGIIIGEADRLRNLLDQMLGPAQPARSEAVNVHEALARVQQLVAAEMPSNIDIRSDYDPSLPSVQWDMDQMIQTLLNLVRNAAQALASKTERNPEGGGRITLRTRSFRHFNIGSQKHRLVIRIEVIDDGPGIPDDMLNSIFLPMVTGRPDGTGLGLSIAQTLVQRCGGLIECVSEPSNTIFSVYLPISQSE